MCIICPNLYLYRVQRDEEFINISLSVVRIGKEIDAYQLQEHQINIDLFVKT